MDRQNLTLKQKFEVMMWLQNYAPMYTRGNVLAAINRDLSFEVTTTNLKSILKMNPVTFKEPEVRTKTTPGKAAPGTVSKILARYLMKLYDDIGAPYGEDLRAIAKARKLPANKVEQEDRIAH